MILLKIPQKHKLKGLVILGSLLVAFLMVDRLIFPLPVESLSKPNAIFVYSRDNHLMRCFMSSDDFWRKPVEFDKISPFLINTVLACEDRWFYYHPGFNIVSLISAAIDNIESGKIVRGGSTITMQIARMIEPKPRNLKSKIIEIFRAVQLEIHYSKKELLEFYFNLAPYGGNIEGIAAASYFYFDKPPNELSPGQIAFLTALPRSPEEYRPDRNNEACYEVRNKVLKTMLERKLINKSEYNDAIEEKIPGERTNQPMIAPHLCQELVRIKPEESEIISTVDLNLQTICERILQIYSRQLDSKDIHNASIVVMDNASGEVLALVGSIDFFDDQHSGQINGAVAARSPGSTLKPFVYALALDKGLISPKKYLEDLPVFYSGYSPQNYDDTYSVVVSAENALKLSLNVPAVNILADVGLKDFHDILKKDGITTLKGEYYNYGLPLILGSCEVKLLELANLYRALANGGFYTGYKLLPGQSDNTTDTLFSRGASFIVAQILSDLARPEFPSSWEFAENIPIIAWKTGTSYGRKDAWSIGFNPQYTIGVWVGNFTAEPSPELVGVEAAAPVLFEIFSAITSKAEGGWFSQPDDVSIREVCSISGLAPGPYCPTTVEECFLPGVTSSKKCDIHQEILVDNNTGFWLCRNCLAGKDVRHEIKEIWPAEIATWLGKTGSYCQDIPIHNPSCRGNYYGDRPVINSPRDDGNYIVRDYISADLQGIMLDASAASGTNSLFWFIDGNLYCALRPGERAFYTPMPGKHNIVCSDDQGRSKSITISISN